MKDEKKEVKAEVKKENIEGVVYSISRRVDKIVKWLETIHGADIDGDGKIGSFSIKGMLVTFAATMLTVFGIAFAEDIWVLYDGDATYGTAKVASDLSGACTLTVDNINMVKGTYSADNGSTLTPADGLNYVTPSGQANGYTNAVTLADPLVAGRWIVISVATGATNKLGIADSGNAKLSAAFVGDADDTLTLISTQTNVWEEVSRSSN